MQSLWLGIAALLFEFAAAVQHLRLDQVYKGRMSRAELAPFRRTALPGEHTSEILAGLGYSESDISHLRASGAVGPVPVSPFKTIS